MRVPSKAPIRETRLLKTGMALAMMYEMSVVPKVQPNQEAQWMNVLAVRWREPRRTRMKMYFPGNWRCVRRHLRPMGFPGGGGEEHTWTKMVVETINPGRAKP